MPFVFCVGAAQSSVALPLAVWVTAIAKAGKVALVVPSLTAMAMFEYVPTLAAVGVPDNSPVALLKVAQLGAFFTLKLSTVPLGSVVAGVKLYALPSSTEASGVPDMVGLADALAGALAGALADALAGALADALADALAGTLTGVVIGPNLPVFAPSLAALEIVPEAAAVPVALPPLQPDRLAATSNPRNKRYVIFREPLLVIGCEGRGIANYPRQMRGYHSACEHVHRQPRYLGYKDP